MAQAVFTDLARKAGSLSRRATLTGWLYTSAHFAAAKIARTENRRRDHEEKFMREPTHENQVGCDTPCPPDWEQIRPALDDAMHELKETDREAVLLRYFENCPFAEIGAKLGLNENTARMRVERALEKLRDIFAKRGITTVAMLASVISANAVQPAPANLAATLTTSSLAAIGIGAFTFPKIMTMTNLKLGLGALIAVGVVAALVIQHQTQNKLRTENESLRQQIAQLQTDNESLSNRLAVAANARLLSDDQMNELLKLRNEVTLLRRQQTASAPVTMIQTNSVDSEPIEIHTKARFISIPREDLQLLGVQWMSNPQGNQTGVLTAQRFKVIREALRGASDVETISEPEVITGNGREANMCAARTVAVHGTNTNVGINLDIIPVYLTNSSSFDLNLKAELSQLIGDSAQPDAQIIQVTNRLTLLPGQTAILEKEIPEGGWLPDDTNVPAGPRSLLVFVTPQVVDSRDEAMKVLKTNQ